MATDSIPLLHRRGQPRLEVDCSRSPLPGYEPSMDVGFIRCLDHSLPSPLARWHCHDEYELHLVTETSGKAFVGDWIGPFEPGHVVLCGPLLPHAWISLDLPEGGVAKRDLGIQFRHEPIEETGRSIPELNELLPLLKRSCHGIEFFGFGARGQAHWHKIKQSAGISRVVAFLDLMHELTIWSDYRLLSSSQLQGAHSDSRLDRLSRIVKRITDNIAQSHAVADVACDLGMSVSCFSRLFQRVTGNTYTDFVNRMRINRACQLLMNSDACITNICYDVGFNNVANFNRRFLEIKGVTPSEFRRQAERRFGDTSI